jgi:hypothetical protein
MNTPLYQARYELASVFNLGIQAQLLPDQIDGFNTKKQLALTGHNTR